LLCQHIKFFHPYHNTDIPRDFQVAFGFEVLMVFAWVKKKEERTKIGDLFMNFASFLALKCPEKNKAHPIFYIFF
jgi:hypothetical protein